MTDVMKKMIEKIVFIIGCVSLLGIVCGSGLTLYGYISNDWQAVHWKDDGLIILVISTLFVLLAFRGTSSTKV